VSYSSTIFLLDLQIYKSRVRFDNEKYFLLPTYYYKALANYKNAVVVVVNSEVVILVPGFDRMIFANVLRSSFTTAANKGRQQRPFQRLSFEPSKAPLSDKMTCYEKNGSR
jgi:hypothetical protein